MTEKRKQELRRLLEEAMGSLVVRYENSPFTVPVSVYRMYLEERWAYYGIDFLSQAYSVQFRLNVANGHTKLKLCAFIRDELACFIDKDASPDFNLLCIKAANYRIERDSNHGNCLFNHGGGALPLFMIIEHLLAIALVRGVEESASVFDRCSSRDGTHVFYRVIALLEGIKLEREIEVYKGARIVPLPSPKISGKMEQCLIGLPMWSLVNEKDSFFGRVLLVIETSALAIFHRPSERMFEACTRLEDLSFPAKVHDVEFTCRDAVYSFKDIFCRVLSLVCNSAVETVFEAMLFEQGKSFDLHPGGSNMLRYANRSNTSTEVGEDQINEAKRLYEVLENKPDLRERLQIPIDRWIMSKTSKRDIDKMIDLGIALEALYVYEPHPEKRGKDWQIRHHASAYLKTDACPEDTLREEFNDIYGWRSAAVHKGRLPRKKITNTKKIPYSRQEKVAFVQRAQALCRKSIMKIIEDGQIPDWGSLILGGNVEEVSN